MSPHSTTRADRNHRPAWDAAPLSGDDLLARYHECLAKADLFAMDNPELSRTWMLLAGQWLALLEMPRPQKGWHRPDPHGLTPLLQ